MSRKLIFFDIDGTLTDVEGHVPASAVNAIHEARQNGVLCVINSGRPFGHIVPAVKEIGFDGYVCSCGQHVICGGKTVFRHRADRAYSRYVAEISLQCRLDIIAEAEEAAWGFFRHTPGGYMLRELGRFQNRGMTVYSSPEEGDFILDKFCVWSFADSDRDTFVQAVSDRYSPMATSGTMTEFVLNGHSKQTGGEAFMKLFGIGREDVYALGDSLNDLPMFRAAGHTAAMQNSSPELLQISEYVTGDVHTGGVAQALRHFGLI